MDFYLKTIVASLGALSTYIWGEWGALISILISFTIIDYLTGVLAAAYRKQLSSAIGFKGIAKKVMIFALVAVGNLTDGAVGDGSFIRDAVIFFFIANELISILENAAKTDLPIPPVLQRAVEALKGRADKNE